MTRLLLLLLLLTGLGIGAAWLAEHPGQVTMIWRSYRIDTSAAFMLTACLAAALLLAGLVVLLYRLMHAPDALTRRRTRKTHEKGLTALTRSLIALAAADMQNAELQTRRAEKLLGRTPLTLLLSAQLARMQGDDARTQMLLEQMLEHKETEYLAARYLSETATRQHQLPKAREMAQRAQALNPGGLDTLLSLHIRLGEWQQAAAAIAAALRRGQITRARLHRYRGVVHAQHTLQLMQQGQDEAALAVARQALKQLPGALPVLQVAARAYLTNQQPAQSLKLLHAAWKKQPHAALIEDFLNAAATLPREKKRRLASNITKAHPDHYASHILRAQLHMACADWRDAREQLQKALALSETAQACRLMAEIERMEGSDGDAHGRWLIRAAAATADAGWICTGCGSATRHWEAHCHACHAFDALEWKQRDLVFVAAP